MKKDNYLGKFVVVRTESAGVHVGILVSRSKNEAELENARCVWQWEGANTLYELAAHGASMDADTRISEPAPGLVLLLGVISIIQVTSEEAKTNLSTSRWL